ncbi:PAS domain-containing protein [Kaistella sp. G5-32]|uniref:histidine kinase n=1 Tax=Kaistella gelatinilytica TaxID=2787636 RepID=A0ABS0FA55_9FLAO|nr:ATP-binding protein [Kaistella gelatinilytica]MBF8456583.1 PAS domain-containing protein [Kaistella gelatinilytica]
MKKFLENSISLESLTSLFSQAPVGLAILMGENHVIANANTQVLEYWGKGDNVIGLPVVEALPEIADQEFPGILKEVFETGKTIKGNKVKALLEKDGVMLTYYFDFIYSPIRLDQEITGVSVVAINVTDQVLSEQKLRETELRFKELMEISDYSVALFKGEDLIIEFANDQMIKSWGKTRAVVGQKLEEAVPELEGQPFAEILRNIFKTGEPYNATEDKVDLVVDGILQQFYYSISYRPLRNADGEIDSILNMGLNVTELVESRQKAQIVVKEYRDLAEAMPQIVWTTDQAGGLIYFNENMLKFLNIEKDEIENFDFSKIVHPKDAVNVRRVWLEAIRDKKIFELEARFRDIKTGEYIWFINRATPVLDEEGNLMQWIGTSTNINDFKILAAQKDTFLGIASHELKTPLTSLKLYAQVLERMLRKTGDEKNAEFAKKMDVQIIKLTSLIGDLLDVTKINSGKIYLNETHFDFEKLVIETIEEQQLSTDFTIEMHIEKSGTVFADKDRVSQVITNFISNAIKYSPNTQKIIARVERVENNIQFSVQDFGIGIPEDKKDKVFEQYYRVSGDEETTFPGLGLGLFISAQIVERSNGKIWVNSIPEKGSSFCFSLPVANQ